MTAQVQILEGLLLGGDDDDDGDVEFSDRNVSTWNRAASVYPYEDTLSRTFRNVLKFLGYVVSQYLSAYVITTKVCPLCDPVQQITIKTRPHGAAWWCICKLHCGYVTFWTQAAFCARNVLRHRANGSKRTGALKTTAVFVSNECY
jgi:hypothetical protein